MEEDVFHRCVCDPPVCQGPDRRVCNTNGKCYIFLDDDTKEIQRNCFNTMIHSRFNCDSKASNIACCMGDLCNQDLALPPDPDTPERVDSKEIVTEYWPIIVVVLSVVVLTTVMLLLLWYRYWRKRAALSQDVDKLVEISLMEQLDPNSSTGSGSGQATLVNQTVGKQVSLVERIGNGRFGEVWRGKYQDEDVAVKIFTSLEEDSWRQEMEIYTTGMLRHDNILGYMASDTVGRCSTTQNWIIVHFHKHGSLYDYLQQSDIDMEEMLILTHSAAAGLSHLHNEIKEGRQIHEKPAIAHRDIKSKNILVKANGECCIGDFGHAVKNVTPPDPMTMKLLVGTKRYMAPEVLAQKINPDYFEAFKFVDVYAFSLVMWEVARRARPFAEAYRPPFFEEVPADPSFEEMRKVVLEQQRRPAIPNKWTKDPLMTAMSKLIRECWSHNPKARLTMLRVRKDLGNLLRPSSSQKEKPNNFYPKLIDSSISTMRSNSINSSSLNSTSVNSSLINSAGNSTSIHSGSTLPMHSPSI